MILSGYHYHCSAGESFDSVALGVYGDEKYAAELLCANPGLCEKMVFTGGEKLELPVVEVMASGTSGASSAPWKE